MPADEPSPQLSKRSGKVKAPPLSNRAIAGDSKPKKGTKMKVKKLATLTERNLSDTPDGDEVLDLEDGGIDDTAADDGDDGSPLAADNAALVVENVELRELLNKYKAELAALKSIALVSGDVPHSLRERLMGPGALSTDGFR